MKECMKPAPKVRHTLLRFLCLDFAPYGVRFICELKNKDRPEEREKKKIAKICQANENVRRCKCAWNFLFCANFLFFFPFSYLFFIPQTTIYIYFFSLSRCLQFHSFVSLEFHYLLIAIAHLQMPSLFIVHFRLNS